MQKVAHFGENELRDSTNTIGPDHPPLKPDDTQPLKPVGAPAWPNGLSTMHASTQDTQEPEVISAAVSRVLWSSPQPR